MPASPVAGSLSCISKPLTWAEETTWLRAWHAGDGSCKLWDARTLACLHALAGESGGATSCYLALTGAAESPDLQRTVLVRPPHRPRYIHPIFMLAQGLKLMSGERELPTV